MQPGSIVKIRDLTYTYPGYNTAPVTALRAVNLDIASGETVVLTGPSGSGKTSLLRCINGLIPHSDRKGGKFSGEVTVAGMNTAMHSVAEISEAVGTVFQNPDQQIVTTSVDSEIAFGLENRGVLPEEIEVKIKGAAELLGIGHLLKRETSDLSWGEKQRVAIASVLVMQPEIVVMDEPFSGLDPQASSNLVSVLDELNRKFNITFIIAEHRVGHLADLMDRIVVMKGGMVLYDGPPGDNLSAVTKSHGVVLPESGCRVSDDTSLFDSLPGTGFNHRTPVIELIDVGFTYPCSLSPALDDISLKIYDSQITVILGSNGSGKSTLARHLNGTLKPDSGKVILFGEDTSGRQVRNITHLVGLVSQHADYQLFEENITEEFSFGPGNMGMPDEDIRSRIPGMIASFDLGHIDPKTPPLRLSAGERQRVAIGSVLMMKTPVVVLDEPTLGLDEGLKRNLAGTLKKLCRERHSVVVMTHDLEFASFCADRVLLMDSGKIGYDSLNCEAER
ncbi:MAG: energy-coupling factor ABC transporter ATP-binding protein [Methanoculleus sp.]|nr:energy-coupling factor ABC transporter ATP-binding protein [Methanoculleus sp.]